MEFWRATSMWWLFHQHAPSYTQGAWYDDQYKIPMIAEKSYRIYLFTDRSMFYISIKPAVGKGQTYGMVWFLGAWFGSIGWRRAARLLFLRVGTISGLWSGCNFGYTEHWFAKPNPGWVPNLPLDVNYYERNLAYTGRFLILIDVTQHFS